MSKELEILERIKTAPSFMGGNAYYRGSSNSSDQYLEDCAIIEKKLKNISLSKEEFIGALNFIYKQEEKQEQFVHALENLCPGNYCDCWLFNEYASEYIRLIQKLMNDVNNDILYFLYDMERGKSSSYAYKNAPYHNESELYDYLVKEGNK